MTPPTQAAASRLGVTNPAQAAASRPEVTNPARAAKSWSEMTTPVAARSGVTGRGLATAILLTAVVSAVFVPAGPISADTTSGDPYGADPLGLIARFDQTSADSVGDDRWEVWVCRVGASESEGGDDGEDEDEGEPALTPEQAVRYLNWELGRWFGWLSADRYRISFSPGGAVSAPHGTWPVSQQPCAIRALAVMAYARAVAGPDAAAPVPDGVLVVVDDAHAGGYACNRCYRGSDRVAVVGGGTITTGGAGGAAGSADPAVGAVAHQLAHALGFPHSSGRPLGDDARDHELDNPMDFMGGGAHGTGTPAVNRYAAGWIDPPEVAVHAAAASVGSYELSPVSETGVKMLAIRLGEPGWFAALGPRVRSDYDAAIPAEGVEMYLVDQRAGACGLDPASGAVCWGTSRSTRPVPASEEHVLGVGDVVRVGGVTVHVTGRSGGRFRLVAFAGNRFTDDDGSSHEQSIEAVARAGITLGCSPAGDRYCPLQPVNRAQMAALLARSLPDVPVVAQPVGVFTDVPVDAWYAPAIEALHAAGVVAGYPDGTFRPHQPVNRAQMAGLLARGLPDTPANHQPVGVFTDVPVDAWYAPAVEALHASGVTRGCTDETFCPRALVTRAQAASFLARALGLQGYDDPAIVDVLADHAGSDG